MYTWTLWKTDNNIVNGFYDVWYIFLTKNENIKTTENTINPIMVSCNVRTMIISEDANISDLLNQNVPINEYSDDIDYQLQIHYMF